MAVVTKLAILVPDGAYPLVLGTLLRDRRESLGIADVPFEIIKDAFRDSSLEAVSLLRPYLGTCSHALVVRDLEGSGWEGKGAGKLKAHLEESLHANGWDGERASALVVEPEIETWLRFGSSHMQRLVAERARKRPSDVDLLFSHIVDASVSANGGLNDLGKPTRPKEAFDALLAEFGVQRSNAIYGKLAKAESLTGCQVPSFIALVEKLQTWFPLP